MIGCLVEGEMEIHLSRGHTEDLAPSWHPFLTGPHMDNLIPWGNQGLLTLVTANCSEVPT